jgi:hypothetical protein
MAASTGKKIANTGMRRVPRPKPEKRVSPEVIRAAKQMTTYSIMLSHLLVLALLVAATD